MSKIGIVTQAGASTRLPRLPPLCVLTLLIVNLAVVAKLFGVEYLAYNGSIEATFIAIARVMVKYPFDWGWWPLWSTGMPFENSYLPLLQWIVASFSFLTGLSPARSFHIVAAGFYALGAPALFWMLLALTRKLAASFVSALAYSCFSLCALFVPAIRVDSGGALNLRRLQILVFYGEAPHTLALTLLPVAIVCFSRALTTRAVKWKILAGVMAASVVLSNAFGIVVLGVALLCWLAAFRPQPFWKAAAVIVAIGAVSYCWTAPWLSPSMIREILNSPTAGGDYRYRLSSWIALAGLIGGYLLLWWILRRARASMHLQFLALFGYVFTAIVVIWYAWQVAVIPQPGRYQLEMDLALLPPLVFAAAALVERLPKSPARAVAAFVVAALGYQIVHSVVYARGLIRSTDPSQLVEFRVAKWLDEHRHGQRAFLSGSESIWYNVFTDNPQHHGGHIQFEVNTFVPIVDFTIYSGLNAGERDAEYSIFWLKAFGAHAISVSGPKSTEYFRAFVHPRKFDGVLPLLWRDGDDAIYEVPSRSPSLAHVIPSSAVVARRPIHGLDIAPAAAYVAALDDPRYPVAAMDWTGLSKATIRATVHPGEVVAVQETYDRGWEAWANGKRLPIRQDALGLIVIDPDSSGPCEISLRYTGGNTRIVTRALSLAAMLAAVAYVWIGRRRR